MERLGCKYSQQYNLNILELSLYFSFANYADWSPRAWHSTVTYNGTLLVLGGSPLNSEVWILRSIRKTNLDEIPITRAMYLKHTYKLEWEKVTEVDNIDNTYICY